MKVGVEEEFIVVDPETFWITPGAFHLASKLIFEKSEYVRKCSVELPLHSGSFSRVLSQLSHAFCVFELKTDAYTDIDLLRDELVFHRKNLIDVSKDEHLWILPCGLHPGHHRSDFIDNCASLHIHIDYTKDRFERLYASVPFLISISSNSPFLDETVHTKTNRMLLSPHINVVDSTDVLQRNADLIYNPTLNTVEIKVLDSQITTIESIGMVSIVKEIAENKMFNHNTSKNEYVVKRSQAIQSELTQLTGFIKPDHLDELKESSEYAKAKLSMNTGANWQTEIFQQYGLSSVVESLATSFSKDKRVMKKNMKTIKYDSIKSHQLNYIFPYLPFLLIDKYRKYRQDMSKLGGLKAIRTKE